MLLRRHAGGLVLLGLPPGVLDRVIDAAPLGLRLDVPTALPLRVPLPVCVTLRVPVALAVDDFVPTGVCVRLMPLTDARGVRVGVRDAGGLRDDEWLRDTVARGVPRQEGDVDPAGVGNAVLVRLEVGVPVTAVGVPLGDGVPVGNAVAYAERDALGDGVTDD